MLSGLGCVHQEGMSGFFFGTQQRICGVIDLVFCGFRLGYSFDPQIIPWLTRAIVVFPIGTSYIPSFTKRLQHSPHWCCNIYQPPAYA